MRRRRALIPLRIQTSSWASFLSNFPQASCKLCKIDPLIYLRDVLDRINTHPANQIEELLPQRWKERFLPHITLPRWNAESIEKALAENDA
ncbi:transposase domain-containing protein [Planctomycetota bacterium]